MPQTPYIPSTDAALDNWSANFATLIAASPSTYGLLPSDATTISTAVNAWHSAYVLVTSASTKTAATVQAKENQKAAMLPIIRNYSQTIKNNNGVTDDQKTALGINLPNSSRTPIPPPSSAPTLGLVGITSGQITIRFSNPNSQASKAKPYGVTGVDLYYVVGPPPTTTPDLTTISHYGSVTKSPFTVQLTDSTQNGKQITFYGVWSTQKGDQGPPSAPLTTTIVF